MSGYNFWQPVLKIMLEAADVKGFSLDILLYNGDGTDLRDEQRAQQQALRNCSGIVLYSNFRGADRELIRNKLICQDSNQYEIMKEKKKPGMGIFEKTAIHPQPGGKK